MSTNPTLGSFAAASPISGNDPMQVENACVDAAGTTPMTAESSATASSSSVASSASSGSPAGIQEMEQSITRMSEKLVGLSLLLLDDTQDPELVKTLQSTMLVLLISRSW